MAGPLAVSLTADISKYEAAMTRARDLAARHAGDISGHFTSAAANINTAFTGIQGLSRLPGQLSTARAAALGLAATGAGIVAAYALVSSAIGQANAQLDRFIKLGENAERSGVGVEFFQRFSEAAKKAKIDVAEVEAALKRAGQAVTPKFDEEDGIKKRLNEVFESGYLNDYQSKGLADYNAASTNEQRIRAAVTAMQELNAIGERLAAIDLAERLFGSDVASRIRSGRLEIEAIAASLDQKRDDLVKQEEVERAAEFRERLEEAYRTIDEFFRVSVALEGSGRAVMDAWLGIAEAVAKATVNAGNFYTKIQEMQGPLANYLATVSGIVGGTAKIFAEGLSDQVNGTRTLYERPIGPEQPGAPANAIPNAPQPPRRPLSVVLDEQSVRAAPRGGGGGGGLAAPSSGETLDALQTYVNGLERSTAALKAEMDALGKSNAERLASINLAKAEEIAKQQGITLSTEQIARIRETSRATAEYKDRIEEVRDRQEALRSIGSSVLSGLISDARNGVGAMQMLLNAVNRLFDRLTDQAANGLLDMLFGKSGGTSGGMLSGLFGGSSSSGPSLASFFSGGFFPAFADGGLIQGPGTGTSDSIVARVSTGEFVVNAKATGRHRAVLEAINSGNIPAFATGGMVGASAPSIKMPSGVTGPGASQIVTIAPSITVQAAGGTPEQNSDLAQQTAKAAEGVIRSIVVSELRTQMRPGNMLRM